MAFGHLGDGQIEPPQRTGPGSLLTAMARRNQGAAEQRRGKPTKTLAEVLDQGEIAAALVPTAREVVGCLISGNSPSAKTIGKSPGVNT